MIKKGLIEKLYEAAHIQRWNDHVRPVEFTELDKQAHKMVIAYILAKFEELDKGISINWDLLIEGGLFEFLQRVILTDIKPPVFYKLMEKKGKELNDYVLKKAKEDVSDITGNLGKKFEKYLQDPEYVKPEKRILKAAHYLASNWEFKIIYHSCPFIYGIEKTKEEIENQIEDHFDISGVQKITLGKKSFGFIDLCGQLRFQKRWAQSPRVPQTSVLGHMLIVANLTYLCSCETNSCRKRKYNNFFSALFHDLPEVLTRDIISPVKRSIEGLESIITEYEDIQVEQRILPLLHHQWRDEMSYFIDDQFKNRITNELGQTEFKSNEEIADYNEDKYSPIDGEIIQACDHLAAFVETSMSINHGIKSHHLFEGHRQLSEAYKNKKIQDVNFGQLFDYFPINS